MFNHNLISRLAPAKINFALHVTDQREDGYHYLDMIVAFAQYGDHVAVRLASEDSFTISGRYSSQIPISADNLVVKARDLLRSRHSKDLPSVSIHLEKNLPVAAGIGGGSADAAAAIIALSQLWQINLDAEELFQIGLELGADIPMCLHSQMHGGPLKVSGIGEELKILPNFPSLHVVLVNDGSELSTPDVFKNLNNRNQPALPALTIKNSFEDIIAALEATRNDLLEPARLLAPNIDYMLMLLQQQNAAFTQMSGSGATCFGIFKTPEAAHCAAQTISAQYPNWFVTATDTLPSR